MSEQSHPPKPPRPPKRHGPDEMLSKFIRPRTPGAGPSLPLSLGRIPRTFRATGVEFSNERLIEWMGEACQRVEAVAARVEQEGLEGVLQKVKEDRAYHPKPVDRPESLGPFLDELDGLYFLFPPIEAEYDPHECHSLWLHQDTGECENPESCVAYRIGGAWYENYRTVLDDLYRGAQTSTNALILALTDDAVDPSKQKEALKRLVGTCLKHCQTTLNMQAIRDRFESLEGWKKDRAGKNRIIDSTLSQLQEEIAKALPKTFRGMSLREAIVAVLGKKLNIPLLVGHRLLDELDKLSSEKRGGLVSEVSLEEQRENQEGETLTMRDTLADDRPCEVEFLTKRVRKKLEQIGDKHAPQIVECILQGPPNMTQEQIAKQLGLSLSTVEKTIRKIREDPESRKSLLA